MLQEQTIAAGQGQQYTFDRTVVGLSEAQTIFQVPVGQPARIEAVYFKADGGMDPVSLEAFVLFLCLADDTILFAQPTPSFNVLNVGQLVCTWARGNNDTFQLPGFKPDDAEATLPVFANPPLPDIVLPATSTVKIALWEDTDENTGDFILVDPAITYTMGTGPTSTSSALDTAPLLLPLADS